MGIWVGIFGVGRLFFDGGRKMQYLRIGLVTIFVGISMVSLYTVTANEENPQTAFSSPSNNNNGTTISVDVDAFVW